MKKDERKNAKGQITCILEYLRSWLLYVNSMGRVCRIGRTSHTFESKHTYMDYVWGKNQRHMRGGRKGHRGRGNRMTMLFRTDRMRAKGKSLHSCHWGTNTRARPLPNAPVFGWCWTRWKCKVCDEQHITCRWLQTVSLTLPSISLKEKAKSNSANVHFTWTNCVKVLILLQREARDCCATSGTE